MATVTFEHEVQPPETWRGAIGANKASTAARRAIVAAARALPNRHWTSALILLEREA
jgi:hypothetical protein